MKVKYFLVDNPMGKKGKNLADFESSINAWLAENAGLRVVGIQQSTSGGSLDGTKIVASVWYEPADSAKG